MKCWYYLIDENNNVSFLFDVWNAFLYYVILLPQEYLVKRQFTTKFVFEVMKNIT